MVSIAMIQVCPCSEEAAIDDKEGWLYSKVPIEIYFWKLAVGQIWPMGYSFQTLCLYYLNWIIQCGELTVKLQASVSQIAVLGPAASASLGNLLEMHIIVLYPWSTK